MEKNKPYGPGQGDFIYHVDDFVSLAKHADKERRVTNFVESSLDDRPKSWLRVSHILPCRELAQQDFNPLCAGLFDG